MSNGRARIDFRAVSRYHTPMKHFRPLAVTAVFISASFAAFASERPIVTGIKAEAGSAKRISVTWTPPRNPEPAVTSLAVFRTEEPVASFSQIASLDPVAQLAKDSASFADSVPDYKDYYYAVVAVTEKGRYDIVIPSVNATVNGVHALLPKKNAAKILAAVRDELQLLVQKGFGDDEIRAAKEHDADIVGLSALMTTTMIEIDQVVNALRAAKSRAHIIVGGAAVTEEYAREAGADYYAPDGVAAVRIARRITEKQTLS